MRRLRSVPFLAVVMAVLLAGCGGGKDEPDPPAAPTPQQQVRTAAQNLLRERDGAALCRTRVTTRFVEEVFDGDPEACAASSLAEPPEDGEQVVGDVQVSGSTARVLIAQRGGEHDGLAGHYGFAREGRAWKLDRFEDDIVRVTLVTSANVAGQGDGKGAFTYAPLRACATKRFQSMPISDARTFLFAALNEEPKVKKMGNKLLTSCPRELAGYVADRLAEGVGEGHGAAYVRCMRRELAGLLLVTGLAEKALSGNTSGAGTSALGGLTLGADRTCAKKDGGRSG